MPWSRLVFVLGTVLVVSTLAGCGGGGGMPTEKVSGRVVCKDQPVADASVQFVPQGTSQGTLTGKAAIGKTGADGRFTLSTYKAGDGAVIGRHKVLVGIEDPEKTLPGKLPADFTVEVKKGQNEFEIKLE